MKYDAKTIIDLNRSISSYTEYKTEWAKTEDGELIDINYDVNPYLESIRKSAKKLIRQFERAFFQKNPAPPEEDKLKSYNIVPLYYSYGSHQFLFGSGDLGIPVIMCSDNYYDGEYARMVESHIKRNMAKEGSGVPYHEGRDHGYYAQSYCDKKNCAVMLKRMDSRENEMQVVFFEKAQLDMIAQKIRFLEPKEHKAGKSKTR